MKENLIKFTHNAIFVITALIAASSPLFFIPVTSEFFEFNKFTFFFFAVVAGTILWALRMVLQKKFSFTRTPLDVPLIIFLAVFFVAALSSIDQRISIYGTAQRPWPSLLSVLTLTVFYFVASSNIKSRKNVEAILGVLVSGTTAAALIAVISYFAKF